MTAAAHDNAVKELLETTCSLERVAVVFNPVSGTDDCAARRSRLETLTRAAGLRCELAETDQDSGAAPLARKAVEDGMERLLVSGGDGSVTEAADVLAGTSVTLGVLPSGTGNLLALNLGIPSDCEQAIELALRGTPRPFDVGRANGKVFLILAGMGVDGRMIRDADRESKRRLGVMAYFLAALRNIRRQRVRYTIDIDGRILIRPAMTVMVANLGRITGGVELVPGCDPFDGLLEAAILRARGPADIAALVLAVLFGRKRPDLLEVHRGRHIIVEAPTHRPVELDGNEAGSTTRLEVEILPGALQLVAPTAAIDVSPAKVLLETTTHSGFVVPLFAGAEVAYLAYRFSSGRQAAGTWRRSTAVAAGIAAGIGVVFGRNVAAALLKRGAAGTSETLTCSSTECSPASAGRRAETTRR